MVAKMILPLLGGTPAVWNTCMVFFQAILLAGYAYAHATTAWLSARGQVLVHVILLFIPLLVLPIAVGREWAPPDDHNPILWLLAILTVSVGLPFFVLSSSAPLLQKWFASTGHPSAKDPYFLYAASNLGSMLALLSYPTLIEPWLPLKAQTWIAQNHLWALAYGLLIVLVAACGWAVWRRAPQSKGWGTDAKGPTSEAEVWEELRNRPTTGQRVHWVALAFVPSSLMLAVTSYITLDIAAVPLLWVIPLALYLLSFILVFARWPLLLHKAMILIMPLAVLLLIFTMLGEIKMRVTTTIALHLVAFFLVAMVCHGELARRRPSPRYLTEFYLLMSLGGVLGGLFNALVAPMVFWGILEYPIAMVLACLLLPRWNPDGQPLLNHLFPGTMPKWVSNVLDFVLPIAFGTAVLGFLVFLGGGLGEKSALRGAHDLVIRGMKWLVQKASRGEYTDDHFSRVRSIVMYGLPVLVCYACVPRPLRFGLCVAALFLAGAQWEKIKDRDRDDHVLHQERTFFGVLTIKDAPYNDDSSDEEQVFRRHSLLNGDIMHGEEIFSPELEGQPITYYHKTGPIGQLFSSFQGPYAKHHLAVIGLGSGTMACYDQPGREITFYDINPAVVRIAQNPDYFTFWSNCQPTPHLVLGDARLKLEQAPDHGYDVIVVDAFSSDAIPIHLITREAIELYFRKLTEARPDQHQLYGGVLMVHISNRYLDLRPVLSNIAQDLRLFGMVEYDRNEAAPGKTSSEWVLLVRDREDLGWLAKDTRWEEFVSALGISVQVHSDIVEVETVDASGLGNRLGLETGDHILKVNGKLVQTADEVRAALPQVGEPFELAIQRMEKNDERWQTKDTTIQGIMKKSSVGVWTDDFSNLLSVFNWKG